MKLQTYRPHTFRATMELVDDLVRNGWRFDSFKPHKAPRGRVLVLKHETALLGIPVWHECIVFSHCTNSDIVGMFRTLQQTYGTKLSTA